MLHWQRKTTCKNVKRLKNWQKVNVLSETNSYKNDVALSFEWLVLSHFRFNSLQGRRSRAAGVAKAAPLFNGLTILYFEYSCECV